MIKIAIWKLNPIIGGAYKVYRTPKVSPEYQIIRRIPSREFVAWIKDFEFISESGIEFMVSITEEQLALIFLEADEIHN